MKSSLKNMILMLFVIAFVCSGAVALVYNLTEEPIAIAQQEKAVEALKKALPEFDAITDTVEMTGCVIYPVSKDGATVGFAVKCSSPNGFSGEIELMVGFREDGIIHNIEVLQQAETPGLGANMVSEGNVLTASFVGKNAAELNMAVKKDGGDIDALTAATISSRAYSEAVGFAYNSLGEYQKHLAEEVVNVYQPTEFFPGSEVSSVEVIDDHKVEILSREGSVVGCVVAASAQGFNRKVPVRLAVCFDTNAKIVGVEVLEQQETPSLGGLMCEEDNVLIKSVKGKDASKLNFSLVTAGGDVDCISGATISSRAYGNALKDAYETYKKVNL